MTSPSVQLEAVDVRFGRVPVLSRLSLVVPRGSSVGVVGPNGSGKTTLLRLLATLLPPTGGNGSVLGVRLGTQAAYAVRGRIGLIGHRPAVYGDLTLGENLGFVARVMAMDVDRARLALDMVGLARAKDRRADRASWGMQRRLEFARLLMTEPELVLLDEPHAGLDHAAEALVATVVSQVRARQGAVVLASHHGDTLTGLIDDVYELSEGGLASVARIGP